MRADQSKEKIFIDELYRLRVISNKMRKLEFDNIINWTDDYAMVDGTTSEALVYVLPTRGCKYAMAKHGGCSMCTLPKDNPLNPSKDSISSLPDRLWHLFQEKGGEKRFSAIKFYTSGSFLDRWELPIPIRENILAKFVDYVDEITIETRCEFITKKNISNLLKCVPFSKLIVAIGQETTDNEINRRSINKGHSYKQFKRAVNLLHENGIQVKGYLLLKPVFMSEISSLEDVMRSAYEMKKLKIQNISINPSYIGRLTLMDEMFKEKTYRPPWLWTVYYATYNIKKMMGKDIRVICDPIAAGSDRGPRNCGRCDRQFKENLKQFSSTQDITFLEALHCECKSIYKSNLVTEHLSSGMGIDYIFNSSFKSRNF